MRLVPSAVKPSYIEPTLQSLPASQNRSRGFGKNGNISVYHPSSSQNRRRGFGGKGDQGKDGNIGVYYPPPGGTPPPPPNSRVRSPCATIKK